MEKNQPSCPKAMYQKIFRAITSGPAFTTIRRLSNRQQTPSSAAIRPKPSSKQGSEFVPIKFDYTTKPKPIAVLNGSTTHTNGPQAVPLMVQQVKTPNPSTDTVQSGKGKPVVSGKIATQQQHHHDDKFTAFILETRERIMSRDHQHNGVNSQKIGHGHGHGGSSRKDHHFSEYINQTKRKIKSTLSTKDRSESFIK